MEFTSLSYKAPKLTDIRLEDVNRFLKERIEYEYNVDSINARNEEALGDDYNEIQKVTLVASIDNDLLIAITTNELKIPASEVTDELLNKYLNDFLKVSSNNLGWDLDKYMSELVYNINLLNPMSRCLNLWMN